MNETAMTEEINLEYKALSHAEISGAESERPVISSACGSLEGTAELRVSLCPKLQAGAGVLLSHRILPSDSDLLINDLFIGKQVVPHKISHLYAPKTFG